MDLIKAVGSSDPDIKNVGYLGLMQMENHSNLVIILNTIINDLKHYDYSKIALISIANLKFQNYHLKEIINNMGHCF
jgi:hypothetical protein